MSRQIEWLVALNEAESARLVEYRAQKQMSCSAVLRQALRVYDMMERTPGAYEAVQAINRAALGPKYCPHGYAAENLQDGTDTCEHCSAPETSPVHPLDADLHEPGNCRSCGRTLETGRDDVDPLVKKFHCAYCEKGFLTMEVRDHHEEGCEIVQQSSANR